MNSEQKRKLRLDAIRDSGIIDRVSNFREFCNRYYKLTPSKNFRSVLYSEFDSLNKKMGSLRLGELGVSVTPATEEAHSGTAPSETREIVSQSEALLASIRKTRAEVDIELETKYRQVEDAVNIFNSLEKMNNSLDDDAPERPAELKNLAENFRRAVSFINPEAELYGRMKELIENLNKYYVFVKSLPEEKFRKILKPVISRRGAEKLMKKLDALGAEVASLSRIRIVPIRERIDSEADALVREIKSKTDAGKRLAAIGALLLTRTGKREGKIEKFTLADQKFAELNILENSRKAAWDIHELVKQINSAIKA